MYTPIAKRNTPTTTSKGKYIPISERGNIIEDTKVKENPSYAFNTMTDISLKTGGVTTPSVSSSFVPLGSVRTSAEQTISTFTPKLKAETRTIYSPTTSDVLKKQQSYMEEKGQQYYPSNQFRIPFTTGETTVTLTPQEKRIADFGTSLVDMFTQGVATLYGETIGRGTAIDGKINLGIDARRLGFTDKKYVTAQKEYEDAIARGEDPLTSGIRIASESALDASIGGSFIAGISRKISGLLLKGGVESQIAAWDALGRPKTIQQAESNFKKLATQTHPDVVYGSEEAFKAANNAIIVMRKSGVPNVLDIAKSNMGRYAEVVGRETPITSDLLKLDVNPKVYTPVSQRVSGLLPGTAIEGVPQPRIGMQIQPVKKIPAVELPKVPVTSEIVLEKAVVPEVKQVTVLRPNQTEAIGSDRMNDVVARERFDIPNLNKISFGGSDRDVYDLGDGNVLKIAKTARGLAQNRFEGELYAPVPESIETGKNYVVVKKAEKPNAKTKELVNKLNEFKSFTFGGRIENDSIDMINKTAEYYYNKGDEEMGSMIQDLNNYTVMINDLTAIRNWGTINGEPVLLDAGTLGNSIIDDYKDLKNMSDPEFREIYNQSSKSKKEFGDKDSKTMYKKGTRYYPLGRGAKIEESKLNDLLKEFIPADKVKFIFNPELLKTEKSLGVLRTNKRMEMINPKLKPVIELYTKKGKVYARTAFHESYHYMEEYVFSPKFVQKLNDITLKVMNAKDHKMYDNKIYDTPEKRAAEYRADEFAKEQTKKSGYNTKMEKVIEMLKQAISKMVEAYKKAKKEIDAFVKARGGSQKGSVDFFADANKKQLPEEIQKKQIKAEVKKEAIQTSKIGQLDKNLLKSIMNIKEGGVRELGDVKNPEVAQKIQDMMREVGISDPLEFKNAVEQFIEQRKSLKLMEEDIKKAINEIKSQDIIDRLSEKAQKHQEKMIEFSQKYPKLAQLVERMTTAETKGAIRGYKLGVKIGTQETRDSLIASFKENKLTIETSKDLIVKYAKDNLSLAERGKLMTVVRDAKTQEDVIKAFVRIDRKVAELEVKDAITNLKVTVAKMTDNNAISADYRNKIKDIIDDYELTGHTQKIIDKIQATQDYISRQASVGENVELPQRIVEKLKILGRTQKDELTLSQIQGLQNEVELLARLGETKWASKQALYDAEKELRKTELLNSVSPINSKQVKNIGLEKSTTKYADTYIKAKNYLQKTRISLTPIEGLADITGMTPMKNVLDLNFGNYLTYNDDITKQWYELTKTFDESNFKRVGAYAMSEQAGGVERLANSGLTQETIDNLKLTPEEKKAYNFVRETFDAEFPLVKKYALDNYNKDVGEVKNYVSFMSDNDAMSELEIYDRFGSAPDATMKTKTVEQGYTESRAKLAETKLELNIDKIFRRHTDDVAYMLTMGKDVKQYFEIVNSPEMREKLGDVGAMAWLQYLDLMARKGGSEGAKRIYIIDMFRKNLAAGVLSFRISSALVQFTSFADTMGTLGSEWSMKGATSISTSKEWRNFVMDNFPEVKKAVGDDVAFREFGDSFISKLSSKGLKPLQYMDGLMRSTAVSGAYQKLAAEKGIPVDLANPDKELIQEATKLMRQSQGSSFFKDQPLAITTNYGLLENKSLNKAILTFQSFVLNRWDNLQRQIYRLGIKEGRYGKAFMSFFWMVIFAAAMEESIRRGIKFGIGQGTELLTGNDDKTKYGSFAGASTMNVIQSVPIAGSLISSMEYGSNPIPIINAFEQIQSGASSVWGGKALQTKLKGGITTLGAIGTVAGIPGSSQAAQLIKGLVPPAESTSKTTKSKTLKSPTGLPELPSLKKTLMTPPGLPKLPKL